MTDDRTHAIRQSYDRIAGEYARKIYHELDGKPFDRELLARFAEATRGRGEVCDMGCGPGHVARFLHDHGAVVFGLDISTSMVEQARQLNPGIRFEPADMFKLNLPDGALAAIVAFYSIVNIPKESLSDLFREMSRVLRADGLLLLAFHIGDQATHFDELWGHPICMDFFYFQPIEIRSDLEKAGFIVTEIVERDPYAPDVEHQSRRAYILARNPGMRS